MQAVFQFVKKLCQDESVRVLAEKRKGAAARLEWGRMP